MSIRATTTAVPHPRYPFEQTIRAASFVLGCDIEARSASAPSRGEDHIYVTFAERSYALPSSDRPIAVTSEVAFCPPPASPSADVRNTMGYRTLALDCSSFRHPPAPLRELVKKYGGLNTLCTKWNFFFFQESPNAPAASVHPPPENDDDPAVRPPHRPFDVSRTVKAGVIEGILASLGNLQKCDLPIFVPFDKASIAASHGPLAAKDKKDDGEPSNTRGARTEKPAEAPVAFGPTFAKGDLPVVGANVRSDAPRIPAVELRIAGGFTARNPLLFDSSAAALAPLGQQLSAARCVHQSPFFAKKNEADGPDGGAPFPKAMAELAFNVLSHCYLTTAYRRELYAMVASGALPLLPAGADSSSSVRALSPAEAAASLPWDESGVIKAE